MAYSKIPKSYLDTKLITSLPPSNPDVEAKLIHTILSHLSTAKQPILLVDGGAARSSWERYVPGLMDALKLPTFTTLLGKGAVDESSQYHVGSYVGIASQPEVTKVVEDADLVVVLGNLPSDFNT